MKKFLVVALAGILQAVCSTAPRSMPDRLDLLSFDQIASEISVQHEILDDEAQIAVSLASN